MTADSSQRNRRGARQGNRRFLDSAVQSRQILQELVKRRKRQRISQTEVATRMGTSQSAIARIETAGMDIRMSTLERYAAAIGHQVNFKLTRLPQATAPKAPDEPAGSVRRGVSRTG